jgi:hypothetical protein
MAPTVPSGAGRAKEGEISFERAKAIVVSLRASGFAVVPTEGMDGPDRCLQKFREALKTALDARVPGPGYEPAEP